MQSELLAALRGLPLAKKGASNEAATRLLCIDKILCASGWPREEFHVETATDSGDYIDYLLSDSDTPWMIVEAKKSSRTFQLPSAKGSHQSLASLARRDKELDEVLKQAARYCNDKGVPYAAVTNGFQWIFFRGLSSTGKPWLRQTGLVFESIEACISRVAEFNACLNREFAFTSRFAELLEKSADSGYLQQHRPVDLLPKLKRVARSSSPATRAAAEFLFSDIYGEDRGSMLDECYVEPGHSSDFDTTLQRLLKDSPNDLVESFDETRAGTPDNFIDQLAGDAKFNAVKHPIAVVGNVGAGKTTFLRRVLVNLIRTKSVIAAYVDLEGHATGGTFALESESEYLAKKVLDELRDRATILIKGRPDISDAELPQVDPDSSEILTTIFRDRIQSERKQSEKLWTLEPVQWEKRKRDIFDDERRSVRKFLGAYIRHLKARIPPSEISEGDKKRIPIVLFFDNLDQGTDDYQKFVYGFCSQLTRETGAIAVICLREDTYRGGRRAGGFLTSSPLHYVFHVESPPLDHVIRRRIEYGKNHQQQQTLPVRLREHAEDFKRTLSTVTSVFGNSRSAATRLIASLAGQDSRAALRLVRTVVHGATECEIEATATDDCVFECLSAHSVSAVDGIQAGLYNIFDVPPSVRPLHALPSRLVAYFVRANDHVSKPKLELAERALSEFCAWGYPPSIVREVLLLLVRGGMLRSPELTRVEAERAEKLPTRLVVTAMGHIHLTRVIRMTLYRAHSALYMRWYSEKDLNQFVSQCNEASGVDGLSLADVIEARACSTLDAYLARTVAEEDANLAESYQKMPWVREVCASATLIDAAPHDHHQSGALVHHSISKGTSDAASLQTSLFEANTVPTKIEMPTLPIDHASYGSVWYPRILWALTYVERACLPDPTAAEIDRVLQEQARISIHGPNVARAFRDLKKIKGQDFWSCKGRRYCLTNAGRFAFTATFPD
jgi:hypothetical protein